MQVSWIDAERLRQLVAQIAPEQESVSDLGREAGAGARGDFARGDLSGGSWPEGSWLEPAEPLSEQPSFVSLPTASQMAPGTDETAGGPGPEEDGPPMPVMPLSRIRDKLRAIRQRASEAGILSRAGDMAKTEATPPPQVPTGDSSSQRVDPPIKPADERSYGAPLAAFDRPLPPFEIPQGSREQRLAAFARWALQLLDDDGSHVLVMNGEGDVLWGGEAKAGLVLSAMMAWGSAMHATPLPASGVPGVMRTSLASGHVLTVVPCETADGVLHAAVVASKAMPEAAASLLQGALAAAIS